MLFVILDIKNMELLTNSVLYGWVNLNIAVACRTRSDCISWAALATFGSIPQADQT